MNAAPFEGRGRGRCGMGRGRGHRGMMFAPDMPEEIRAKAVDTAKLRIDLEAEMSAKTINKAKAMEIFAKVQQAENEIDTWRFSKKLERIEAFRTQQELNRKMPPAPKPDAPAPAPEVSEPAADIAPAAEETAAETAELTAAPAAETAENISETSEVMTQETEQMSEAQLWD